MWNQDSNPWDEFVRRAQAYKESGRLESDEIEYKLVLAGQFAETRDAVLRGSEDWPDLLRAGLASRQGHPLTWRSADALRGWVREDADDALRALDAIWASDESTVAERVLLFCERLPDSGRERLRNPCETGIRSSDGSGRRAVPPVSDQTFPPCLRLHRIRTAP